MDVINFVGIVLGFVGSVLLSAGLLMSREAAIDKETPFWGENPFKIKDVLASRNLALWGFSLLIAGFATTAIVGFARIASIQTIFGVAAASLGLTFLGWLLMLLTLQAKTTSHLLHKSSHFRKALVERLKLQIKSLEDILSSPNPGNYDFRSVKFDNLELLMGLIPNIDRETQKKLQSCIEKIKRSGKFEDMKEAMNECLNEFEAT
ncbi:MAG: hypothetical protein AAB541_02680 [Patescibacteria group bacterium]